MKLLLAVSVLALGLGVMTPAAAAQSNSNDEKDHGEFGVYFDYFRLQFASANLFGVGGRAGFNLLRHLAVEGEMSYDFERSTTQTITSSGITNTFTSNIRLIHVLAGPKIQTTKGPIRFFGVAKAGFLDFGIAGPVTAGTVINQIANIRDGNKKVVYYPGGGIEFSAGRFGIRIEAGDEIFVDNGVNHNLKFMGGPVIRF